MTTNADVDRAYDRWKALAEGIALHAQGTRARNDAVTAADLAWHAYEALDDEVNGIPNRYSFSLPPQRGR